MKKFEIHMPKYTSCPTMEEREIFVLENFELVLAAVNKNTDCINEIIISWVRLKDANLIF